jgi:hypothetical protein
MRKIGHLTPKHLGLLPQKQKEQALLEAPKAS